MREGLTLRLQSALAFFVAAILAGGNAAAASQDTSVGDEWILTTNVHGNDLHQRMSFRAEKGKVSGWIFGGGKRQALTGTADAAGVVKFETKDGESRTAYTGRIAADEMSGTAVSTDPDDWGEDTPTSWRARRALSEKNRPATPRTLDFEPTDFHRTFSASTPPALRIWPGDIVRTKTVDAGGVDEKGKTRVLGGNPQTGPFYVEGAMPGDVIAVHLRRLRLNRPTAISDDGLVDRAITGDYAAEHKDNDFKSVVWKLDLDKGVASPAKPLEHWKEFAVPVRPMLG